MVIKASDYKQGCYTFTVKNSSTFPGQSTLLSRPSGSPPAFKYKDNWPSLSVYAKHHHCRNVIRSKKCQETVQLHFLHTVFYKQGYWQKFEDFRRCVGTQRINNKYTTINNSVCARVCAFQWRSTFAVDQLSVSGSQGSNVTCVSTSDGFVRVRITWFACKYNSKNPSQHCTQTSCGLIFYH